jgi:hypothetical protein
MVVVLGLAHLHSSFFVMASAQNVEGPAAKPTNFYSNCNLVNDQSVERQKQTTHHSSRQAQDKEAETCDTASRTSYPAFPYYQPEQLPPKARNLSTAPDSSA